MSLYMRSENKYKLLIANRGEIARRIMRAARQKNFTVAVLSTPEDKNSLCQQEADAVLEVPSFLNAQSIVEACQTWGAHLIHPGYGFLSENAEFAKLCEDAQLIFIGPTSENMKKMGAKESSKKIAQQAGVPTLNALMSAELKNKKPSEWKSLLEERNIHAPYLVKASGGGGGRGMRIVEKFEDLQANIERASEEALSSFNDGAVFVERYLQNPRHIEIQVFGNGKGGGIFLGERECSLQRRHQKVIEEAPSIVISEKLREQMGKASLDLVRLTKYKGAGTLEFLFDDKDNFYFLEMNTRLQVEHPVTEMVYGVDLVHAQIDLALGTWPAQFSDPNIFTVPKPKGVALEARILAESPRQNFLPTPGLIEYYREPKGDHVRVDTGVKANSEIFPFFDSMISKLIVHANTRHEAVQKFKQALEDYVIFGLTTNIPFLLSLANTEEFLIGEESTSFIANHLTKLNTPLISKNLCDFFVSKDFREKLFSVIYQRKNCTTLSSHYFTNQTNDKQTLEAIFYRQNFFEKTNSQFSITPHVNFENDHSLFTVSGPFIKQLQKNKSEIHFSAHINRFKKCEINVNGEVIILENPGFSSYNKEINSDHVKEIRSPMAGKVYDVLVITGDNVEEGDLLFVIESMKMQLEVRAPKKGVLQDIYVKKGQVLSGPDVLGVLNE